MLQLYYEKPWELMALDKKDRENSVARDSETELDRTVRMLKSELINDPGLIFTIEGR